MTGPNLEEVFKLSGVPTYTFVRPVRYEALLVALRTPGRGVIIEGPSGIGKTTAVTQALHDIGIQKRILRLTARKSDDRTLIAELPTMREIGLVLIDDFHRLDDSTRNCIADFLKTLADEERADAKLVLIGINKAGDALVSFAPDLNNRIDTLKFEANPRSRVAELVSKGEQALNLHFEIADAIVDACQGSFYVAQMLCHEACVTAGVLEAAAVRRDLGISFELVRERVMDRLSPMFMNIAMRFAAGTRLRREGRAPYLHILHWLANANEWSISIDYETGNHPQLKGSVGQVVEKGFLENLILHDEGIASVLHFEPKTHVLAVEDPQFVFFIRNIAWGQFAKRIGFLNVEFESRYDFALSFAGADRGYAESLYKLLVEMEFEVFYDRSEQHRILAENIEEYLAPIYKSEASFVICLLGPEYPKRIWTKFESEQFRERFGSGRVIPIWFRTAPPGMFDESTRVGGVTLDPAGDVAEQLENIADLCRRKFADVSAARPEEDRPLSQGRLL